MRNNRHFIFALAATWIILPSFFAVAAEKSTEISRLSLAIGELVESVPESAYSTWFTQHTSLVYDKSIRTEIVGTDYCKPSGLLCELTPSRDLVHMSVTVDYEISRDRIETYLKELAKKTDHEAEDAKFRIENGRVAAFSPERSGTKLDVEKSAEAVFTSLSKDPQIEKVDLVYQKIEPNVTAGEINDLGISALIGQGRSNFKGSPTSRVRNIKVATERFDGVIIKPGEEFSFVQILGPVDAEHGYLPELVIKKDKTEPEFGGGICQVSTTVFRAAIYSGLEITARRNHAYPVSYYSPQGMDSTIYLPKPDLRFRNNTPGHILIQPRFEGTELIVDFYGASDGRKVEVDGPHIIESNPDRSLKTKFTQKVTDSSGNVLIDDTFSSSYQSPYKYPHPGDAMLAAKPANWSDQEWDSYKEAYKAVNPPAKKKKK